MTLVAATVTFADAAAAAEVEHVEMVVDPAWDVRALPIGGHSLWRGRDARCQEVQFVPSSGD